MPGQIDKNISCGKKWIKQKMSGQLDKNISLEKKWIKQ